MRLTEFLNLKTPDYENLADISILNENFEKIDQNAKGIKEEVDSKEPKIQTKKTGFNLDKTDSTENNTNKLFTAKGAFDLFNSLTTSINGIVTDLSNHIIKKVSVSEDGHMAKEDKVKLDGIAMGANNYVLPTSSATVLGGVKVGANLSILNGVLSASVGIGTCLIPVGFTLMTDDNTLNPATLFLGTTWGRIAEERNIRGATANEGVGTIGGSDTVDIAQSNLPNINLVAPDHTHTRGTQEISGQFCLDNDATYGVSGAFHYSGTAASSYDATSSFNWLGRIMYFNASRNWTGATSGASNRTIPLGGSGVALNVTNAYYKVHIWKRLT